LALETKVSIHWDRNRRRIAVSHCPSAYRTVASTTNVYAVAAGGCHAHKVRTQTLHTYRHSIHGCSVLEKDRGNCWGPSPDHQMKASLSTKPHAPRDSTATRHGVVPIHGTRLHDMGSMYCSPQAQVAPWVHWGRRPLAAEAPRCRHPRHGTPAAEVWPIPEPVHEIGERDKLLHTPAVVDGKVSIIRDRYDPRKGHCFAQDRWIWQWPVCGFVHV
jgi:hypothetical protein